MSRIDFDREFSRSRSRFNWIFGIAILGIVLSLLIGIAQYAAVGYAALKYGPRYLDAGAKYLERQSQ